MAFTRLESDIANISKLSDRPNQNDGLSAAQLKGRFDKAGIDIKDYVNDVLISELESVVDGDSGADNIGSTPLIVSGSATVGGQLRELNASLESKVDSTNIYTKTNLQTGGQAVIHWENLTHVPNLADGHWKTPVANKASLPLSGNELGDNRVVLDDGDGKQAVYTCVAITGTEQWAKIGDVDWNSEEATRVAQENQRVIDEDIRRDAEESRVSAESSRATAETNRQSTETLRANAEIARANAESKRVQAENARSVYEPYNASASYVVGNKVTYEGSSYINISPSTGVLPTNASYWLVIASKGDTGLKGDKPAHRWVSTSLQVENPDGTWGDAVNLKGESGEGSGNMHTSTYDTTGKNTDIFNYADTGLSGKVDNARVLTDVPLNAKFTDTVYTHPTTAGNKHVPTGGASNQILKYSASGTAVWDNESITPVVDNLTSTDTDKALSANQGKVLNDLVSTKLSKFVGMTAGTSTALTVSIANATLADFTNIQVRLHTDIGAEATLNLNSLGAKPIYTSNNVAVGLGALTGSMLNLMYNSTLGRWYLLNILSEPPFDSDMVQFFAIPGASGKIRLKIEKPTDADGVMLRYKTTAWVVGDTKDTGTLIASITEDTNYKGVNQWYEVIGLTNGTAYYIKAFPYKGTIYNETIGNNETLCKAGGLELEYSMDSISGSTLYDTSGNTRNGTISGATSTSGIVGNGITAPSTGNRINASSYIPPQSNRTITFIYKMPSTTKTAPQDIVIFYGSNGLHVAKVDGNSYLLRLAPGLSGDVTKTYSANATAFCAYGSTSDTSGWAKFDNDERISKSMTKYTSESQYELLGNSQATDRNCIGILDQYRVWSRSLEDYELDNLYNGGAGC